MFEKQESEKYSEEEIKDYIRQIIQKYKIEIILKREMLAFLDQTDFAYKTKKCYAAVWIYFMRELNYKNPTSITNEEIRQYLLKMRKNNCSTSSINNTIRHY